MLKAGLSRDQMFEAHYSLWEAPPEERRSTYDLAKVFPSVSRHTITKSVMNLKAGFLTDQALYDEYLRWKRRTKTKVRGVIRGSVVRNIQGEVEAFVNSLLCGCVYVLNPDGSKRGWEPCQLHMPKDGLTII